MARRGRLRVQILPGRPHPFSTTPQVYRREIQGLYTMGPGKYLFLNHWVTLDIFLRLVTRKVGQVLLVGYLRQAPSIRRVQSIF